MNIVEEVQTIGPGHRRQSNSIRMGYWTPELASWDDKNGFKKKKVLELSGAVNASPLLCITKKYVGHLDLTVQITGNTGKPDTSYILNTKPTGITGFSENYQYNEIIYRREWITGGSGFKYKFTIPAHTKPGKVFRIPTKRIYEITNINISPRDQDQPLTSLGFYALADNGSKLLYAINWNKVYNNLTDMMFGMFGHPNKCPKCGGDGDVSGYTCNQCEGYGYSGPNASGFLLDQIGKRVGVSQASGDDLDTYMNKIWAKIWHIIPTAPKIKDYLAHFARINTGNVELSYDYGSDISTGTQSIVSIYLPYNIPLSKFHRDDGFWSEIAKRCEPAGVNVKFSFLAYGFTGQWCFEDLISPYRSGYINGIYTGQILDQQFGFYQPFSHIDGYPHSWLEGWGNDWYFFNCTGTDDGSITGFAVVDTGDTFISGFLDPSEYMKWACPSGVEHGKEWHTGFVNQGVLQTGGVYYWDNFWGSGIDGIQY